MLRLKDLMRPEPADAKAPGEPDEIKYRRHRRRALDVEESPDEALTMMQRLKKARSLKRYKANKIAAEKYAVENYAAVISGIAA